MLLKYLSYLKSQYYLKNQNYLKNLINHLHLKYLLYQLNLKN